MPPEKEEAVNENWRRREIQTRVDFASQCIAIAANRSDESGQQLGGAKYIYI